MLIYCGNHFIMHVSEIIMWYTASLYSIACQLYPNKTEGKKKNLLLRFLETRHVTPYREMGKSPNGQGQKT